MATGIVKWFSGVFEGREGTKGVEAYGVSRTQESGS